jgi:uncharacterized protein YecE (DUF72 family)
MLKAYSNKLNSVEVNSTFYRMPAAPVTAKWAESTVGNFRFSFKANRRITHIKKLRNVTSETSAFLSSLKPLGEKLGCVLVQLPPYMKQDYETLEAFLNEKPESLSVAVELRHDSWFGDSLNKLLSKYDTALCVADTEDMSPVFANTASFAYARLRKDHYSRADLRDWVRKLSEFAKDSSDCFIYVKHDETGQAAELAVEFASLLNP